MRDPQIFGCSNYGKEGILSLGQFDYDHYLTTNRHHPCSAILSIKPFVLVPVVQEAEGI